MQDLPATPKFFVKLVLIAAVIAGAAAYAASIG
jgi:hypothetical protein